MVEPPPSRHISLFLGRLLIRGEIVGGCTHHVREWLGMRRRNRIWTGVIYHSFLLMPGNESHSYIIITKVPPKVTIGRRTRNANYHQPWNYSEGLIIHLAVRSLTRTHFETATLCRLNNSFAWITWLLSGTGKWGWGHIMHRLRGALSDWSRFRSRAPDLTANLAEGKNYTRR